MYIGNNLQVANPSYKIIDDISSGFNGSTTSFALQVSGATPVPFPISTQQVMISVNGVVQEPDPSGSAGFKLLGSNIVFSSAPANGHAFFGVINAGADYVTAGSEFPDGSVTSPSFTFESDTNTGWFRSGSGAVGYSANGVQTLTFDGNGLTASGITVTGNILPNADSSRDLGSSSLQFNDAFFNGVFLKDNKKLFLGTDSDLQIYHNNVSGYISNSTGNLVLESDGYIWLGSKTGSETYIKGIKDGAAELYWNGSQKVETTSSGMKVNGVSTGDLITARSADTNGNAAINILSEGTTGSSRVVFSDTAATTGDGWISYSHNTRSLAFTTAGTGNVALTLDSSQNATFAGTVTSGDITATSSGNAHVTVTRSSGASGYIQAQSAKLIFGTTTNHEIGLMTNSGVRLTISASGDATFASSVSDNKGNVRSIPRTNKTSSYTLTSSDAGKCITASTGASAITVPTSTMSEGDAVTIYNNTSGDITITQGSGFTLNNSADATTGNRTLATRGLATIWFLGAGDGVISGAGLS